MSFYNKIFIIWSASLRTPFRHLFSVCEFVYCLIWTSKISAGLIKFRHVRENGQCSVFDGHAQKLFMGYLHLRQCKAENHPFTNFLFVFCDFLYVLDTPLALESYFIDFGMVLKVKSLK